MCKSVNVVWLVHDFITNCYPFYPPRWCSYMIWFHEFRWASWESRSYSGITSVQSWKDVNATTLVMAIRCVFLQEIYSWSYQNFDFKEPSVWNSIVSLKILYWRHNTEKIPLHDEASNGLNFRSTFMPWDLAHNSSMSSLLLPEK